MDANLQQFLSLDSSNSIVFFQNHARVEPPNDAIGAYIRNSASKSSKKQRFAQSPILTQLNMKKRKYLLLLAVSIMSGCYCGINSEEHFFLEMSNLEYLAYEENQPISFLVYDSLGNILDTINTKTGTFQEIAKPNSIYDCGGVYYHGFKLYLQENFWFELVAKSFNNNNIYNQEKDYREEFNVITPNAVFTTTYDHLITNDTLVITSLVSPENLELKYHREMGIIEIDIDENTKWVRF